MSGDVQFKQGDLVVYPAQGVAEIVKIETKTMGGRDQKTYEIRVLDTEMKILLPIEQASSVGLRKLIDKEEVKKIIDVIKSDPQIPKTKTWNRRYRAFVERLKTGSIYNVAEVYRDLSYLRSYKGLSIGERRMLEMTKFFLIKEISLVINDSEEEVEKTLEQCITDIKGIKEKLEQESEE